MSGLVVPEFSPAMPAQSPASGFLILKPHREVLVLWEA